MKHINFEHPRWGHALHTFTWQRVKPESVFTRIRDWWTGARRYSVMCHCSSRPEPGDMIAYGVYGGTARAAIYRVEPCGNPDDMFTLFILRDRKLDHACNRLSNMPLPIRTEYDEADMRQVSEVLQMQEDRDLFYRRHARWDDKARAGDGTS